ncbi:hypothetical protein ACFFRR_008160 [Megaselia abdita]
MITSIVNQRHWKTFTQYLTHSSVTTAKYRKFNCISSLQQTMSFQVDKEDLKKRLTPLQYQVTQEAATERPFTGCYNKHYEKGVYHCIICNEALFTSDTKYDSGCGWPAFNDVLDKGKVTLHRDASIPVTKQRKSCTSIYKFLWLWIHYFLSTWQARYNAITLFILVLFCMKH